MRWLAFIALLLDVWPAWGQTFNRRYDLRENGRPQVAWNIERRADDGYLLNQGSFETDTLDTNLFFTFSTVALTRIDQDGEKIWDKRLVVPWHATASGWALINWAKAWRIASPFSTHSSQGEPFSFQSSK